MTLICFRHVSNILKRFSLSSGHSFWGGRSDTSQSSATRSFNVGFQWLIMSTTFPSLIFAMRHVAYESVGSIPILIFPFICIEFSRNIILFSFTDFFAASFIFIGFSSFLRITFCSLRDYINSLCEFCQCYFSCFCYCCGADWYELLLQ